MPEYYSDAYADALGLPRMEGPKMEEKNDTSPFIRSRRIQRIVIIREEGHPPSKLFDTVVTYPSNSLPEWFAPLQPIVEDETFTSMVINLGGAVYYKISIEGKEGEMNNTSRNTQFSRFAALLLQEMYNNVEGNWMDADERLDEKWTLIIAQRAYDLVLHTLDDLAGGDRRYDEMENPMTIENISDMTEWTIDKPWLPINDGE